LLSASEGLIGHGTGLVNVNGTALLSLKKKVVDMNVGMGELKDNRLTKSTS
jgi:hypothetical protein